MISIIPIQNLYYLLLYAWDVPEQKSKVRVDTERCHSLPNLFVHILIGATERLLKQGLTQEYQNKYEEIEGLRGKLCIGETLKNVLLSHGKTICEVDELTHDVLLNQIVYTTLCRVARMENVDASNKDRVQRLLRRFPATKRIRLSEKVFEMVLIHRNNRFYRFVLHLCQLLHQSLLPKEGREGAYEFLDFTQDEFKMNVLFERFLMNFCKQHCRKEYPDIHREYIDFQLTPFGMMFKQASNALPTMETDVTLYNPSTGRKKIIDAKYYRETLVSKYGGQEKVRREHLSQIISYVMNQEDHNKPHTFNTSGTLVYPTINEDFDFSYRYKNTGHTIHVQTVNFNQDWRKIEERIKEIIR